MTASVHEILAPLAPHWDRIIRRPLSLEQVKDLERRVGLPAPAPFREYLTEVGLFQDLTWGASSIQVYDSVSEFVSASQFLSELLPPKYGDLFPFGHDGAGDEFCLPTAEGVQCRIHFVDHETAKVRKRKDFSEWLQSVVAKVLRGIRRRPLNECKVWCVQFSLPGWSFDDVLSLLGSVGIVKTIDSDWMNPTTSEAGVTTCERRFEFNGQRLQARRQEYAGWDAPCMYFDLRESLGSGIEHSQIRALDALFKAKWSGYKLINYGPLEREGLERIERSGESG